MLVCLMLFMAVQATAQVSSIVDLFGKYKFTATVEFTAEGEAYKSQLPAECDAEISEDATYIAKIVGFAGSQAQQNINAISIEQSMLKVLNLNNPALWSNGLILANENGDNPYGVWDNAAGEWAVESYGPVYYTFDPATKEISIPDFTVVKMTDYTAAKGTIIAKYTNVKMTLVEGTKVEIADISGNWDFKAGNSTYSTMAGSTIPTEFAIALAKTDDTGRAYNATFAIEGFEAVTLPATFDGNSLAIAYDSTYLDATKGIRFGNMNGSKVKQGSIEFKSQSEEAFSLYSGFSFVVDSIGKNKAGDADSTYVKLQQWYMDGTLKLPTEAPAFDWAGVYNVKADLYVANSAGIEWPTEFQFEVTYYETSDIYCVTSVFGYDIAGINYGGLMFTPAEDGKSVEINTGNLASLGDGVYMKILDMNLTTSPIKMTVNEDGTMSVMGLSVAMGEYGSNENVLISYYSNLVITKETVEDGEEDAPAFDWYGTWEVTAANVDVYDGKEYSSSFYMTIEELSGSAFITQFMSNDVKGINYGGILLTIADDNKTAEMQTGKFAGGKYPDYLKIYDMNASESPVLFTANENGSISIANFFLKNYNWDTAATSAAAFYKNVTATKCPTGIENIVVENAVVEGIYDMQGRKIDAITTPGLYIVNGKKVLVK